MNKSGGEPAADGDKKFIVLFLYLNTTIDSVRHKQERDAEPKPRLQKDSPETEDSLQGKTKTQQQQ